MDVAPGTSPAVAFTHLVSDYDARYYRYLWREMMASDLYAATFHPDGQFCLTEGQTLRRRIMEVADQLDIPSMIESYLGRSLSTRPFLKEYNLIC